VILNEFMNSNIQAWSYLNTMNGTNIAPRTAHEVLTCIRSTNVENIDKHIFAQEIGGYIHVFYHNVRKYVTPTYGCVSNIIIYYFLWFCNPALARASSSHEDS
jgi:hypothetical protein